MRPAKVFSIIQLSNSRAAQNLCEIYGLSEVQYYYEDRPELGKLTIYWQY